MKYNIPYTHNFVMFQILVKVLHTEGSEAAPNELGRIVVKLPLPPGTMSTLYRNDELFNKTYFQKYPVWESMHTIYFFTPLIKSLQYQGYYDTMDAGYTDENDYIFVTARDDDVINVAGHRISTLSLEDAVLRHPDVADAAVFGVPESTKGEVPLCLYVTKDGVAKTGAKLSVELIKIIREVIGPIASFKLVAPVIALPRTRSGGYMNRIQC